MAVQGGLFGKNVTTGRFIQRVTIYIIMSMQYLCSPPSLSECKLVTHQKEREFHEREVELGKMTVNFQRMREVSVCRYIGVE